MKPFLVNIQEQNQDSIPVLAQVQPTEKVDNTNNKPQQKPVKPSQQDDLIALANRDFVLFHTPDKEPYAKACINNRRMVMHLRSDEFKKFLGFKYHQAHRKVPHRQGLDDAIQLLSLIHI